MNGYSYAYDLRYGRVMIGHWFHGFGIFGFRIHEIMKFSFTTGIDRDIIGAQMALFTSQPTFSSALHYFIRLAS